MQLAGDGTPVVFHDLRLERLTGQAGLVRDRSVTDLKTLTLLATSETIPTLTDVLNLIDGRAPLLVEIKSRFDGDLTLVRAVLTCLKDRSEPLALMSFDPDVLAEAARLAPDLTRGLVSCAFDRPEEWPMLSASQRAALADVASFGTTVPGFLAYDQRSLPAIEVETFCTENALPLLSWTVRSRDRADALKRHVDQIIFEGFDPSHDD